MRNDISERNAQFSLEHRLYSSKSVPVNLKEWVMGKDQFFINCSRRKGRLDGYLAIKATTAQPSDQYRAVCVSSVKDHNEVNTFMLFTLISPRESEDPLSPDTETPELHLDHEFDTFVGNVKTPRLPLKKMPIKDKAGGGLEMKKLITEENSV